jgi:hypothetical protein
MSQPTKHLHCALREPQRDSYIVNENLAKRGFRVTTKPLLTDPQDPPSEEILTITVTTLAFSGLFEVQRSTNVPRVSFVVSHGTPLSQATTETTRGALDIQR